MASSRGTSLQTSQRIRKTIPAIIDDVVNEYGDQVKFNLAPGGTYFGMSSEVRTKMAALLNNANDSHKLSRYGDVLGMPELRKLWTNVLVKGYGESPGFVHADDADDGKANEAMLTDADELIPDQEFMITAGANQAFVNVVLATCDVGDEVLLIVPYYFSHFNALVMTGVVPITVPVDKTTFQPRMGDIEERITERSKALVVVNPGNPSGKVFSKELMEDIQAICKRNGIWLIIDEAYREFVHEGESRISFSPKDDDGIVHIFTASKAYGLAGWRVGAVQYPKRLSEDMRTAQDTIPTHASRCSQQVAYEALHHNPLHETKGKSCNISLLNEVRKIFIKSLEPVYKNTALFERFVVPDGSYYFLLPYKDTSGQITVSASDDMKAVKFLAENHGVLLVPGFAFGMPGYLRVSYGCLEISTASAAAEMVAGGMKHLLQQ